MSTATQESLEEGEINIRQSISPKSGSNQGGTASTLRQSTFTRSCSGKYRRSYSPYDCSRSKERHNIRKQSYFKYSDYRWVLKKIEVVCSDRFSKLLLLQNGDLKEFKILQKSQESEFFQEQVRSYKIHYAHVMPTIRYYSMKLPKLYLSILRERFHKHMQSQLIKFVKQQINDRNKENRIKARWIFEAEAGYLEKYFNEIPLSHSEFKLEKLEWHLTDHLDGEEQLKYFMMQSLTTQLEAIASNREPEHSYANKASDASEPILGNSSSLLDTNKGAELGFQVGTAEEMTTLGSKSSESTYTPTMEFGDRNGTQISFSEAAQNKRGNMEGACASRPVISAAIEHDRVVTAGKRSNVSEPILENSQLLPETNGTMQFGFSVGAAEEMATTESSSPATYAPTMELHEKAAQISFSAAAQNEENVERPCASSSVTSTALELSPAVTTDSENVAPICSEKRRRISLGNDVSDGPCARSQGKFLYESASNLCRPDLCQEEPPAARPPTVIINQMMQAEDTGINDVPSGQTSSFTAVAEQPNMHSNMQSITHQHPCDSTSQTASHIYQPPGGITCSVRTRVGSLGVSNDQPISTSQIPTDSTRQTASHPYQPPDGSTRSESTRVDSLGVSNVQRMSSNQVPTGSTHEQCLADDGTQSNPFTIELSRLLMARDLNRKMHKEKQERIIMEREIELAQVKRKYGELIHNSDMDILEKNRDLKATYDKVYKQHRLAEGFQFMLKASAGVVPVSPRAQRIVAEPNRSPYQRVFQFPIPISASTSAAMYQSMQSSVQSSPDASPWQHSMTARHTAMDSSGRSTTTLMHDSSGGMGSGLAYNRDTHLRPFL